MIIKPLQRAVMQAGRLLRLPAAWRARPGYFAPKAWDRIEPASIALVACHWIGDTLWATQVVPALRERFGDRPIFAITRPLCRDIWHGLLPDERVLTAGAVISDRRRERVSWRAIAAEASALRARQFDLVIDLMGNRYSAAFTFLLRPDCSLGFDGGELGWLYSHRVADAERPAEHLRCRPFRVIEPLLETAGAARGLTGLIRPPAPTGDGTALAAELGLTGRPFAVLAPGAGWPAKQWPPEQFIELGQNLAGRGWSCAVAGSTSEGPLCHRVAAEIAPDACELIGRPLGEIVSLLGLAAGVAANDSGIAHLAAALGRPTAAIFTGATDPRRCGPIGPAAKVFVAPVEAAAVAEFLLSASP